MRVWKRCECAENCDHAYSFRFKYKGRPYQESTGTKNYKLACRIAERRKTEILADLTGVAPAEPVTARLSEVAAKHEAWATGAYRHPTTLAAALRAVTRFRALFDHDPFLVDITAFDLERFRSARLKAGAQRNSVQSEAFLLFPLFREAEGWYKGYERPTVTTWELDDDEIDVLTDDELQIALTGLPPLYATICEVTLVTLARLEEVCGLTIHDLGPDWLKRRLKGGTQKRVRIPRSLADKLRADLRPGQVHLFEEPQPTYARSCKYVPGVYRRLTGKRAASRFRKLFDRLGLTRVHHHLFRHTGITLMCDRGENPRTIQELAGWTTLEQLQRYGHVRDASLIRAVTGNADAVEAILQGKAQQGDTGGDTAKGPARKAHG